MTLTEYYKAKSQPSDSGIFLMTGNNFTDYRKIKSGGGGGLPSEYTAVEWIKTTNSSQFWIDTGIAGNAEDIEISLNLQLTGAPTMSNCVAFANDIGVQQPTSTMFAITTLRGLKNVTAIVNRLYTTNNQFTYRAEIGTPYLIEMKPGTTVINGAKYQYIYIGPSPNTKSIHFMNSTAHGNGLAACYGRFTITKAGVPVLDYQPCRHEASGELGFYDHVTKTFKTNEGTGTFQSG